jgi:nicotinamide-nucleotide amidase
MAEGALRQSRAHIAVAVTGVAGPGGGSADKPVGSVWFGWATAAGVKTQLRRLDGDRQQVRQATVQHALQGLNDLLTA